MVIELTHSVVNRQSPALIIAGRSVPDGLFIGKHHRPAMMATPFGRSRLCWSSGSVGKHDLRVGFLSEYEDLAESGLFGLSGSVWKQEFHIPFRICALCHVQELQSPLVL